jgi:UDP-N-acetylglucosamine acyltransferase
MAYAHVAHDCHLGDHVILANSVQLAGHVEVGDYAIIGGLSGAHQFTRIGAHTYIAGHTVIRKDVPPFVKAAREPIRYVGLNIVGLHRRSFSQEKIDTISQIYHLLFVGHDNFHNAIERINGEVQNGETKDYILNFINSSKAGIIKRYSKNGLDED